MTEKRRGAVLLRAALHHLWLAGLGVCVGLAAGVVCGAFGAGLNAIVPFAHENFQSNVWFLPLAGLLTAAMFHLCGRDRPGMSAVFAAARGERAALPLRGAAVQFAGTWCAHFFAASVGREGAAVQIGASLGNRIGNSAGPADAGRTMTVAGMAAGFSALFMTPLAALCFALEAVYLGRAGARAVVPCVLASFAAFFTAGLYGLAPHTYALGALPAFDWLLLAKCLGMGALFGLAGLLFSFARRFFGRFFAVSVQNAFLRVFAGGVLLSCLLYLTGGRYAGLGTDIVDAAISGEKIYAADFALKILFTAAMLGAGFIGGEVTTMFAAGAALGAVLADIFGVPAELAVCLGYAAVFGAATGTLVAPVLLGCEIFGFAAFPFLFFACAAAYVFGFGQTVYGKSAANTALADKLPAFPRKRMCPLPRRLYGAVRTPKKRNALS